MLYGQFPHGQIIKSFLKIKIMKNIQQILALIFASLILMSSSCLPEDEEAGCAKGTLNLTNKSLYTVQKVKINGVNYGTLDPGDSEDYTLSPGEYYVQQVGISGGSGCNSFSVVIQACDRQGFSCSY